MTGFRDQDRQGMVKDGQGPTLKKRVNALWSNAANGSGDGMVEAKLCSKVSHLLDLGNIDELIDDPEALQTVLQIIDSLAPPGHSITLG